MNHERIYIETDTRSVLLEDRGLEWAFLGEEYSGNYPVIDARSLDLTYQHIIVVDSITAGKQLKSQGKFYPSLLKPLLSALNITHEYWRTTDERSISSFADKIESNSIVLFLSGDTSISEFVNRLQTSRPTVNGITVLPFPLGSGNAIANSIGLVSPFKSIEALIRGKRSHLPLYKVNLHGAETLNGTSVESAYFLIVFSWGLHSSLIYQSDKPEMRLKYGNERFAMAAKSISELDPHFKTKSGEDLSYLLLTSLPKLEETFTISPESIPSVDELHIIKIPHVAPSHLMDIVMKGYDNGAHINEREVSYHPITEYPWKLEIDSEMDPDFCFICIDGSIFKMDPEDNNISIEIENQHKFSYLTLI